MAKAAARATMDGSILSSLSESLSLSVFLSQSTSSPSPNLATQSPSLLLCLILAARMLTEEILEGPLENGNKAED